MISFTDAFDRVYTGRNYPGLVASRAVGDKLELSSTDMDGERITAFPDGYSFVKCVSREGKFVVGNSEGLIKVFNEYEPDLEPISIDINENLTSLAHTGENVLVTNTAGYLELVSLHSEESQGNIFRSELPLRDAVFINDGNRVLCGGDDNKLVLVDLNNDKAVSTVPLADQLLGMSYNATGEILSVSLSDRSVQIYSVVNEIPNVTHTISGVLPGKINSSMEKIDFLLEHKEELISTKTQWSSNGELLLIPSENSIKVYNRSDFSKIVKEFKFHKDNDMLVDFELCYDNKHLAVCFLDLSVQVFDFASTKLVSELSLSLANGHLPVNISWSLLKKSHMFSLYVGTTDGSISVYSDFIEKKDINTDTEKLFIDEAEEADSDTDKQLDGSDEDDEIFSGRKQNGTRLHEEDSLLIDEDDDNEDEGLENDGYPDYYNKDVDTLFEEERNHKRHKSNNGRAKAPSPYLSYGSTPRTHLVPYCPGATPWNQKNMKGTDRRYLNMNAFGYCWAVKTVSDDSDSNQQSITVSFFDRSINKDYHFIDYFDFDLCSMNEAGIVFASSGFEVESPKNKGKLFYRNHENIQDAWERKIPLLDGEFISSISITNSPRDRDDPNNNDAMILVGTNMGYVRFFNTHGVCINIFKSLPVVGLVSSNAAVVFIINYVSDNVYSYSLIDAKQDYKYMQQDVLLPLQKSMESPNVPLIKGMFFNEYNDPCLVSGADETLMILSSWREPNNARWIPILNCKHAITDNGNNESKKNWKCWPLGLYRDRLTCIILKTSSHYPGFPLPLPVEINIKLPVVEYKGKRKADNDDNINEKVDDEDPEECFLRMYTMGRIVNDSLNDVDDEEQNDEILEILQNYSMLFDKSLLKLFAHACQESRLGKALSIARLIKNDKALSAALKISERFEYLNLAHKINKLREDLVEFSDNDEA